MAIVARSTQSQEDRPWIRHPFQVDSPYTYTPAQVLAYLKEIEFPLPESASLVDPQGAKTRKRLSKKSYTGAARVNQTPGFAQPYNWAPIGHMIILVQPFADYEMLSDQMEGVPQHTSWTLGIPGAGAAHSAHRHGGEREGGDLFGIDVGDADEAVERIAGRDAAMAAAQRR
ncbi:hypothetical protein AX16_004379 [Volvariella volvacea WC 439]|nr:hypothetical protein AX16_004379 [Volvariella volvacea WC 439]